MIDLGECMRLLKSLAVGMMGRACLTDFETSEAVFVERVTTYLTATDHGAEQACSRDMDRNLQTQRHCNETDDKAAY